VKEKSQVYLCASWGVWSLQCSIERLDRQNRKFAPILIITEAKNAHFFKCTRSRFVYQELRDFVKMTLTRFSSNWRWLESSHSVKNVTRVESPFFSTWLEPRQSHQKSWLESSRVIDSSHAITAAKHQRWLRSRCQAKFLTCEISDFMPCAHAQINFYISNTRSWGHKKTLMRHIISKTIRGPTNWIN